MSMSVKKRFVLYYPAPFRKEQHIEFEGCRWDNLLQASQAIVGQYGALVAVEIHERAFVLTASEAHKIAGAGVPFKLGFFSDVSRELVSLECNKDNNDAWLQWIEEGNRVLQPTQFDVRPDGSIHFKVLIKHEVYGALQADGTPMLFTDDPFLYWTETDLCASPKSSENHFLKDGAMIVTRQLSDTVMDDFNGSRGQIDMLDEERVTFLHFKTTTLNNQENK